MFCFFYSIYISVCQHGIIIIIMCFYYLCFIVLLSMLLSYRPILCCLLLHLVNKLLIMSNSICTTLLEQFTYLVAPTTFCFRSRQLATYEKPDTVIVKKVKRRPV